MSGTVKTIRKFVSPFGIKATNTVQPNVVEPPVVENATGELIRRIYRDQSGTGFQIWAIEFDNKIQGTMTVTSNFEPIEGDKVNLFGKWAVYKGSPQFKATTIQLQVDYSTKGIVKWLKGQKIKGLGPKKLEQLAHSFSHDLSEVMNDEGKLSSVVGVAIAKLIVEAWNSSITQPELEAKLAGYDLNRKQIDYLIEHYGENVLNIIHENPWELVDHEGIGFKTADKIAKKEGISFVSETRIKAGLLYCLLEFINQKGHCGVSRHDLIQYTSKILAIQTELVENTMPLFVDGQKVIEDEATGLLFPRRLLEAEEDVSDTLIRLVSQPNLVTEEEALALIERAEMELDKKLDRDGGQIEAAVGALTNSICIITGGPGTGKSTTQAVIVKAASYLGMTPEDLGLAAPTGRAAKRLSEGFQTWEDKFVASTIHRLLEWSSHTGGFLCDEKRPLSQRMIVVDELSMVDLKLMASLTNALSKNIPVRLIVVGDVDQLPSVGPGQVLKDMIDSGVLPVRKLTKVHRQEAGSGIAIAAQRIQKGEFPDIIGERMRGFKIQECSQKEIVEQVINLVRFDLPELGFDPMKDIQVLASLKDGDAGVHILNEALKNSLNPILENGQSINLGGRWWTVGDRVMQITNDHSKGIFNGEVGTVVEVSVPLLNNNLLGLIRKPSVKVDFIGNEKVYYTGKNGSLSDHDDISEITLSYAATVHKSQGCEFPVMILVAPESHRMLNRNLLYTAITRAKSECIVVGSRKAVQNAIASIDSMKRNTGLMIRLRKKFELREENQYGVSFKQ